MRTWCTQALHTDAQAYQGYSLGLLGYSGCWALGTYTERVSRAPQASPRSSWPGTRRTPTPT